MPDHGCHPSGDHAPHSLAHSLGYNRTFNPGFGSSHRLRNLPADYGQGGPSNHLLDRPRDGPPSDNPNLSLSPSLQALP